MPERANPMSAWITLGVDEARRAAAEATGLPDHAPAVLVLIGSHPSGGVDWLHRRLGITQSGTAQLLDRLQNREPVTRSRPARRHVSSGRRERDLRFTTSAAVSRGEPGPSPRATALAFGVLGGLGGAVGSLSL